MIQGEAQLMRKSNAIKWEEYPDAIRLLDDYQVPIFEKYFLGEYMRDNPTITDTVGGLNDFLRSLTSQELDIFLNLNGNYGKEYIIDKTFIEILNHCILRTNVLIQRPLLDAIEFIINRHMPSRERLLLNTKSLERIANTESRMKGYAINILTTLNNSYSPPVSKQYIFKPNEQYNFFSTIREIIKSANRYIYYVDNFANHVIIDIISEYCDLNLIREVKILTRTNQKDLRLSKQAFEKQYTSVSLS